MGEAKAVNASDLISRYDVVWKLHEAGGCDAPKDSWADGWDRAITEAISIVMSMPAVKGEQLINKVAQVTYKERLQQLIGKDAANIYSPIFNGVHPGGVYECPHKWFNTKHARCPLRKPKCKDCWGLAWQHEKLYPDQRVPVSQSKAVTQIRGFRKGENYQ